MKKYIIIVLVCFISIVSQASIVKFSINIHPLGRGENINGKFYEQQQDIQSLAISIYLPSAYARSLLLKYDENFTYTEPVIFPTISSSRLQKPKDNNSSKESFIKIYPNPASDYISVDYKLENGNGRIEIIDNIGRILIYTVITNLSGSEVISLSELSSGIYKMVFYENDQIIETKQFSKVK